MRCKYCDEYVDREDALRAGLSSFCSRDHLFAYQNQVKAKQKPKTDVSPEVRQAIFQADGYSCRLCGTPYILHIHHIKYRSEGGTHDPENLVVLCMACHELVHTDKGHFQPLLQEIVWRRDVHGDKVSLVSDIEGFDGDTGN